MKTLRGVFHVAGKEFLHMRRDPVTLGWILAVPLLELLVFGLALKLEVRHIPTAVLNLDSHQSSRMLVTALAHSEVFDVRESLSTEEQLRSALRSGRIVTGIEIPVDYSANQLYRRPSSLKVWTGAPDGVTVTESKLAAWGVSLRESAARLAALSGVDATANPVRTVTLISGRLLRSPEIFVPALTGLMIHMLILLVATVSIVTEKERGTWEQMLVTPLRPAAALTGKLLAAGAVGLFNALCLLALMWLGFGIPIRGSLLAEACSLVAIIVVSLALANLSAAFAENQSRAMQYLYVVDILSMLLCGFVFPRASMPALLYDFSSILPATFFVRMQTAIILRGAGLADLAPDLGWLALMAAVLLTIGMWRRRA